jgi:hypothetical protein
MTWEQLELVFRDYGPIVVTVVVVFFVIGVIHKSWPLISNFVTVINALVQLPSLIETVDDIQKEVKPNGGGSMRDVVNSTAAKVAGLERRFDEHLAARSAPVVQLPTTARKPRSSKPKISANQ